MFARERKNGLVYSVLALSLIGSGALGYVVIQTQEQLNLAQAELLQNQEKSQQTINQLNSEILDKNQQYETLLVGYQKEIELKTHQITQQQKTISDLTKQLRYAQRSEKKYRTEYIAQKQATTQAREEVISQMELEKQRLAKLSQDELAQQKSLLEGEYSTNALKEQNIKRVDELMSSFASLKVNLDVVNTCDKAYLERYGQAKSMLSHMRTYITQHDMNKDYYQFVISNDAMISRKTRELCLEN